MNQPVARSQTEDCYREIPRDSIWPEVRGWKTRLRGSTVSVRERGSFRFALTNLSTSLGFLQAPRQLFHRLSLSTCNVSAPLIRRTLEKDMGLPCPTIPATLAELRKDKQFSVFLENPVTEDLSLIREFQIISPSGAGAGTAVTSCDAIAPLAPANKSLPYLTVRRCLN